ncbi:MULTISPECIES: DUF2480 family protein [unclassified Imperialibacter]|uniref:DUF2480 family protein n=1 Tax=unclassified Imperialibacter TaxID=2629706 RepID=UPI001253B5F2|nr:MULTISPECIES: DUF2480 family protein [unclassified Imperialibacter]CAD5248630.1 conserved hypothetical protein [Imperialibacter sp. 75]CAD5248778.1 conserved hypothetical protein [Imperialibacter sp. 89]VVS97895.1 conserved hypothetical protein [Imperialibacter sp. EC-SDR9]
MEQPIINRVASSSLISLDLAEFIPKGERAVFDLKDYLFQGMILREKDFRLAIKEFDWSVFLGKSVAIYCSTDAIIPTWAYMLVATKVNAIAALSVKGSPEELEKKLFLQELEKKDWSTFDGAKVIIKGCSDLVDPDFSFFEATQKLIPWVSSLMYGEPCSTVPVFKKTS